MGDDKLFFWNICPVLGECTRQGILVIFEGIFPKGLELRVQEIISKYQSDKNNNLFNKDEWIRTNVYKYIELCSPSPDKIYCRKWIDITDMDLTYLDNPCIEFIWYHGFSRISTIYENKFRLFDDPSKIITMSCDLLEGEVSEKNSMWKVMEKEFDKPTLLLHLGDQVYMDEETSYFYDKMGDSNNSNEHKDILKNRYTNTWKPHHQILSCSSNLMINDDHEFYNDHPINSFNGEDFNIKIENQRSIYFEDFNSDYYNVEKSAFESCVDVYDMYQNKLHLTNRDYFSWAKIYYTGQNNDIPTLLLTLERRETYDFEFINEIINDNHLKRIIISFTSFPLFKPDSFKSRLYERLFGNSKFWDNNELYKLYSLLFNWMGDDLSKEVLILGGDVHSGMRGYIYDSSIDREIGVMISSPITNNPTLDRMMLCKVMKGKHNLDHNLSMNIIDSKPRRCYGVIELDKDNINFFMEFCKNKLPNSVMGYTKKITDMGKANANMNLKKLL